MKHEFKVSIIVPVYNVEKFLRECLDSLVNQTIDKSLMEVILVNDGSTDSSLEICREYEEKYPFIKVFSKENEGLSATRNYGIARAKGKYMMFIDSDDMYTKETVERVTDFFDTVYDEVDLVTFFDQPYDETKFLPWHFRFNYYLKSDGVYDLNEFPFICQMRINVCVKNIGENNFLFDTTPGFKQEDQEYNNRVLMDKMKIGYCAGGCYLYNKSNQDSIVTTSFNAITLFETSTEYFERLFSYFPEKIPRYFQAIFFHDVCWKFEQEILYPYHYSEEKLAEAKERIAKLLDRVDVYVIYNYPNLKKSQRYYWLSQKRNSMVTPYTFRNRVHLLHNGQSIYKAKVLDAFYIGARTTDNGNLYMNLYIADPVFDFLKEEAEIYVCENGTTDKKLPVFLSKYGFYKVSEQTSKYYAFQYECDPKKVSTFCFYTVIDGYRFDLNIKFYPQARFNRPNKIFEYIQDNINIQFRNGEFIVKELSPEQIYDLELSRTRSYLYDNEALKLREQAIKYRKEHRIWLYSDLYSVKKDNAYFQFQNDAAKDDGVERYYVYTRPYDEIKDLFTPEQREQLVEFGSEKHKLLYLSSELILSAFFGLSPISPFGVDGEEIPYADIEHFKVIYLQHGVLHASLFVQNSAENMRADKVVISSNFEQENYTKKYHYRPDQLIPVGMARYDYIDKNKPSTNRILFAPSWRNYLAPNTTASSWELNPQKFLKSDYYNNIKDFLESPKIEELLEKEDMYLELKLHPIIAKDAASLFSFKSDRIVLAASDINLEDYKLFITDFSSFVFDYAYLNRPIMYFVPDYDCFKVGLGHYRDLDLPFEKAFGPLSTTVEKAVNDFTKICENNFVPEKVYSDRMENFYVPMEDKNCREKLYKYIMEEMFKK